MTMDKSLVTLFTPSRPQDWIVEDEWIIHAVFTLLFRIAFTPARKPYRVRLLFTHKISARFQFFNEAKLRRADL